MDTWLDQRWQSFRAAINRPPVKFLLAVCAVIGAYDTFGAQIVSDSMQNRLPRVYDVIILSTGRVPWWGWTLLLMAIIAGAAIEYAARYRGRKEEEGSLDCLEAGSTPLRLPHDVDARSALLYAANRTWSPRQHNRPISPDTAHELQRVYDALERFYEYASNEDGLRVWGRTSMSRPLKLIERTHWQDWHIDYKSLFAGPAAEPMRTVPIDKLPSKSSPYYDLRLNKAEVERVWPHELVPILEAARICFEETGLFGDEEIGGDIRLYQFVVLLVTEANRNTHLFSIWGQQLPSTKMARIPTERLVTRCLRLNGAEIHAEIGFQWQREWINVSVARDELPGFIERLTKNQTAGQQSAGRGAN